MPEINPELGPSVVSDLERPCAMPRKNVIHGNLTSGPNISFASAVRRAWLHVGKVSLDIEPKTNDKYLGEVFPGNIITVEPLPRRDEASSISFKVGTKLEILEEMDKPNIWPKGNIGKTIQIFSAEPRIFELSWQIWTTNTST